MHSLLTNRTGTTGTVLVLLTEFYQFCYSDFPVLLLYCEQISVNFVIPQLISYVYNPEST
jgi:hypothetical protein